MPGPDPRLLLAEATMQVFPRRVVTEGPAWVVDRSRPGVWAMSTPYPLSFLNGAAWARPDDIDDVEALVTELVDDFVSRGLPWSWSTTPSSTCPALDDALARAGLTESVEPIMHLSIPSSLPGSGPHDVVVGSHAGDDVLAAMAEAFGAPAEMALALGPLEGHLAESEVITTHVVSGERILGVAQGFPVGDRMVVGNVAVREEARGRGIGAAVTVAVLAAGRAAGVTDAVLTSSPMGHPVYRALGFADVGRQCTWTWSPPPDVSHGPTP